MQICKAGTFQSCVAFEQRGALMEGSWFPPRSEVPPSVGNSSSPQSPPSRKLKVTTPPFQRCPPFMNLWKFEIPPSMIVANNTYESPHSEVNVVTHIHVGFRLLFRLLLLLLLLLFLLLLFLFYVHCICTKTEILVLVIFDKTSIFSPPFER